MCIEHLTMRSVEIQSNHSVCLHMGVLDRSPRHTALSEEPILKCNHLEHHFQLAHPTTRALGGYKCDRIAFRVSSVAPLCSLSLNPLGSCRCSEPTQGPHGSQTFYSPLLLSVPNDVMSTGTCAVKYRASFRLTQRPSGQQHCWTRHQHLPPLQNHHLGRNAASSQYLPHLLFSPNPLGQELWLSIDGFSHWVVLSGERYGYLLLRAQTS